MASSIENVWFERFEREIGIKSSIILHGNIADLMFNRQTGKYEDVITNVVQALKNKGFKSIVKWDRVDGIDANISNISELSAGTQETNRNAYLDDDEFNDGNNDNTNSYKGVDDFFSFVLQKISGKGAKMAFIIDYSDYIFGNANSLSENERNWLSTLSKAVQKSNGYNMLSDSFTDLGNIIILMTHNNASLPPSYYANNPLVSVLHIPLPGRTERSRFINAHISCFNLQKNIKQDSNERNDLIDALDSFSLKEIAQMMKLSRQMTGETLSCEKLINLYRYGEKSSPWEELSKEKLTLIEERLGLRVKGQNSAITKVKDVIIRAYTGFSGLQHSSKQKKPKGTLFFVGPTGVGKTELAKSLAEFIFGDENACVRFDMSEFNHEHSDQRLVGAPPGYVGYEAGGQLTNAVKEKPFCVLLFDEIEKAHGKILDKFLQILEDGRLTDGKGETVYFSETIIIFTSNIGAADIMPENFTENEIRERFKAAVRTHFVETLKRPELLNRIGDNIVAFNFIRHSDVFTQIAKIKFKAIEDFLQERYRVKIEFDNAEAVFTAIAAKAGVQSGGRGVLNILESKLVNQLSNYVFDKMEYLAPGKKIFITLLNEKMLEFDFELR